MWLCGKCGETIEDEAFDTCWKCGTGRDGVAAPAEPAPPTVACTRCSVPLEYVGTKAFHEGTRWGVLGDLGELFVNKQKLDFYFCPRCGRVEFYVDGVGEELRPR